ncbi:MAG: amidohydrolase [Chloroflexota bacterium]|nr:MAG: amidohydrolase [Chloroflexota bacterium]
MTKKRIIIAVVAIAVISVSIPAIRDFRPYPQNLGEYLQGLFAANNITPRTDDFFEPVEDPYLAFAKMLNLIPTSAQSNDSITTRKANLISEQFLAVKDKLYLDGLYGKIDMHEHYATSGDVDLFLRALGCFGISKVVLLPTGLPPDNRFYRINSMLMMMWADRYPDKVIPFCTIDEADPRAAELVEQYILAGAKGLKLMGGHPEYYDEPLNSENMYKVYQKVAEYDVPVLLHGSVIRIPELLNQLDQVLSDFPEVTFIHAHYGNTIMKGIHLDVTAELLDKHPNLYIDLSMGGYIATFHDYLKRDLETIRNFVIKYQDRILFGSDVILAIRINDFDWLYERVRCDIDLCQKAEFTCEFGRSDEVHEGFDLDEEILRKLYYENPKKVLGL